MRRLTAFLLVLLASTALPDGALAAGSPFDLIPNNLSAPGQDACSPQVSTAPDGTSTVTWRRNDGSDTIVQVVRINASGYSGPVLNLSTPGRNANNPQISTAPDGTSTITWQRTDASNNSIVQAVRIDAKGKKGTTLNLSAPGRNANNPQISTAPDGTSTITWQRADPSNKTVVQAVRVNASGYSGPVLSLSTPGRNANNPQISTAPDGTSTITWQRTDASNNSIVQAVRIDAKGKKGTTLNLSAPGRNANNPQISTAPDGTSTITWRRFDGSNTIIQAIRVDAKGKKGTTLNLSAPGRNANAPRVSTAPDGTSTVTWQRTDASNNSVIQAVRIDAKGSLGAVLNLSDPEQNAFSPQVATGANGTSTITWQRSNGSNDVIEAARIDGAGWRTPALRLSAPGQNANGQQVATGANETSIITWLRSNGSNDLVQAVLLR